MPDSCDDFSAKEGAAGVECAAAADVADGVEEEAMECGFEVERARAETGRMRRAR